MPAHPEDELLADLAADVLPVDAARQVEAHVLTCARCSQVLSDAESVRTLLRQAPREAMPPQVMARLEQAFAAARQGQEPQPMPRRAQSPQAAQPPQAAPAPQAATGPLRRGTRAGQTGPQPQGFHPSGPQPQSLRPTGPLPQGQRPTGAHPQSAHPQHPQHPQGANPTGPTPQGPRATGPVPQDPRQTPQQPVQPTQKNPQRPAELGQGAQAAPNTSSYRVRSFKRQENEAAYPAESPTALHPAVREDAPDPELTQPVRKRRRAVAPPSDNTSSITQVMRPVRDKGPAKLTRMDSTQAIRVRRQALEEQKADEPSRWPRISPQIAAAVVLVMALAGGVVTWQIRGGGSGADEMSSGAASASDSQAGPVLASVLETGTKYQKAELGSQVGQLVQKRNQPLLDDPAESSSGESGDQTLSAQEDGSASPAQESGAPQSAPQGNQILKDPAALQACLKAIDRADSQPVAVDLATYNGQEAALIVLPGTSGGYDVWIVARTCQPGADGTIDVVEVDS
ncbi:hypothetical protein Kisp01_10970 [Kineosporia sp. NBRC 101677]|uniref:hypothetical protein n=1 Tax=Kineosporia sp. NBRC 101677 TaxID=3032197 RepID=UPI0024A34CE1|nr:hypothetical protein [Kineosporia sp. NBRC 101677]GLY14081.1 hypothetical protein Kisp01_10970 [Kineosporia sp. NBRC 101677]